MRFLESSSPVALGAGQSASMVVSYIHAAPVQINGYPGGPRVYPGDPTRLSNATLLANGANQIDSLMGFAGYADNNADGIVQQNEFTVVKRSLLDKALLAQTIFDNKFLLPFAPDAPDFFLIPGNQQVTVVWKPSATESTGDPYFQVAKDAQVVPEGGGAPVVNALYDANYRQFDVEGYRIYRGRSDTPTGLKLIAQYDYNGTTFSDYTGQVVDDARGARCAPELGETSSCSGKFDAPTPGTQLSKHIDYDLSGNFVQIRLGDRTLLASGDIINLTTDTAVTGEGRGFPALANTGVPFVYVDKDTRNGLRYFYAVTAFDVNSINSTGAGNTALESARITKAVTPRTSAGNYVNTATIQSGVFGRNGLLTDAAVPTIDPATGKFSKRFPPSNAVTLQLAAFVKELLTEPGEISFSVDSIKPYDYSGASSVSSNYYYTISTPTGDSHLTVPITQDATSSSTSTAGSFPALAADASLAAKYGAPPGDYGIGGSFTVNYPSGYYVTVRARGCVNHAAGFSSTTACGYNGERWFEGDNETVDNPNSSNIDWYNNQSLVRTDFNNSGAVSGVTTIFEARAYDDMSSNYRDVEATLMPFAGAADYRVYWGAGGTVDSVIDLTHDVVVPFATQLGPSWGILNASATQNGATYFDQRAELTATPISAAWSRSGR